MLLPAHTKMVTLVPYPIGAKVSPQVQLLSERVVGVKSFEKLYGEKYGLIQGVSLSDADFKFLHFMFTVFVS